MSQLRQTMERILHRHAEIEEIKAEMKDDYAQAKSAGYCKTALGQAIREIRNREKNATVEAQELHSLVGLYLADFDAADHAGARAIASAVPSHHA
jgi:uncharacterized protein (UPF0335 family)